MKSNKEKTIQDEKMVKASTDYHIASFVKETNQKNGPGHVSVATVKQQEGKTKINHTSFFPGAVGSLVNAVTFGSVPVGGQLANDYKEDLEEADHVFIKKCRPEEYKNGVQAQKKFEDDVKSGSRYYAVFGIINPLSSPVAAAYSAYQSSQLSRKKFEQTNGNAPKEDMCGIEVYDNDSHVQKKIEVDNCCSSSTHICNAAGVSVSNPLVPTFFPTELRQQGFEKIDKEEFKSRFVNNNKK
ncbi:hypothetical protein DGG96_02080 [Legionella qingyii]|uniref:Uncharacterized protein n=1 Tax=Legionella qingyii TaxID=2184757 RepID=A0A317U3A5_9GAMM|nr:hypothetical protein [Legionella qingyii]PWY56524.1 hypothetical protein DGG96_07110 [Legionella qingyii]PWY57119.1 hypothetical protein DGG96_02080 [Legionella qingyii]RUR25041.1 hypothetical protein ELY20_04595 [Legionella qingyii]RUR28687.1 hypothetical protein ELY16_01385 [Legionella qingyii]